MIRSSGYALGLHGRLMTDRPTDEAKCGKKNARNMSPPLINRFVSDPTIYLVRRI